MGVERTRSVGLAFNGRRRFRRCCSGSLGSSSFHFPLASCICFGSCRLFIFRWCHIFSSWCPPRDWSRSCSCDLYLSVFKYHLRRGTMRLVGRVADRRVQLADDLRHPQDAVQWNLGDGRAAQSIEPSPSRSDLGLPPAPRLRE